MTEKADSEFDRILARVASRADAAPASTSHDGEWRAEDRHDAGRALALDSDATSQTAYGRRSKVISALWIDRHETAQDQAAARLADHVRREGLGTPGRGVLGCHSAHGRPELRHLLPVGLQGDALGGAAAVFEDWADHRLFMQAVPPTVIGLLDALPPGFLEDRGAMTPGFTHDVLVDAAPHALDQTRHALDDL